MWFFRVNQLLSLNSEFQDEQTRDRTANPDIRINGSHCDAVGMFFRPVVSGINYHPKK